MTNTTTNTTKTIVNAKDFTTTDKVVNKVKNLVATADKNAFKIASFAAWSCGVSIPNMPINDKPIPKQAFAVGIDKGRATVSRWCGAVELVIKYGQFGAFNAQEFQFSFDKIFLIDKIKELGIDLDFTVGMSKTVKELEYMLKKDSNSNADDTTAVIMYDGVMYEVSLSGLEKLLDNAEVIEKEDIEK